LRRLQRRVLAWVADAPVPEPISLHCFGTGPPPRLPEVDEACGDAFMAAAVAVAELVARPRQKKNVRRQPMSTCRAAYEMAATVGANGLVECFYRRCFVTPMTRHGAAAMLQSSCDWICKDRRLEASSAAETLAA